MVLVVVVRLSVLKLSVRIIVRLRLSVGLGVRLSVKISVRVSLMSIVVHRYVCQSLIGRMRLLRMAVRVAMLHRGLLWLSLRVLGVLPGVLALRIGYWCWRGRLGMGLGGSWRRRVNGLLLLLLLLLLLVRLVILLAER